MGEKERKVNFGRPLLIDMPSTFLFLIFAEASRSRSTAKELTTSSNLDLSRCLSSTFLPREQTNSMS